MTNLLFLSALHLISLDIRWMESVRVTSEHDDAAFLDKHGDGDDTTFHISVARGNAIGRLHMSIGDTKSKSHLTSKGFTNYDVPSTFWKTGKILGKCDEYVWPIEDGGLQSGLSFSFDHGVTSLVFGDVTDMHGRFYRLEFDSTSYHLTSNRHHGYWSQSAHVVPSYDGETLGFAEKEAKELLWEERHDSQLKPRVWNSEGYVSPPPQEMPNLTYIPRLRAVKDEWIDEGRGVRKVTVRRPAILDIDTVFADVSSIASVKARSSVDVSMDKSYKGGTGHFPSSASCQAGSRFCDRAKRAAGFFCGRKALEQCASQGECDELGGRWTPRYCEKSPNSQAKACGCCSDIGKTRRSSQTIAVRFHVEWFVPLLKRFECAPSEKSWREQGVTSLFVGMGWDVADDVDIDMSLVPITQGKRVMQDGIVFFNRKEPPALACYEMGINEFALRAFSDDRTGDSPGDDELTMIHLSCLEKLYAGIEAVVVMANIYRPSNFAWNRMDSVYMRFIAGGEYSKVKDTHYIVRNSEAVHSFVRLSGDSYHADPAMDNNALAVGMLFRGADGEWTFGGLMEGMNGRTAVEAVPALELLLQTLDYPAKAARKNAQEGTVCMKQRARGKSGGKRRGVRRPKRALREAKKHVDVHPEHSTRSHNEGAVDASGTAENGNDSSHGADGADDASQKTGKGGKQTEQMTHHKRRVWS
eukprot:TRINITY_DN1147_c0_g1_i8.p1 TRINITY_DN1147_c0_g1~~TRINITY_DN1147_c0_g1_i8.p1  ORF type:complete len:697 (-),score=55.76 TRINITY_DN1147_c0_g1_i8:30-2120(-)